MRLVYEFFQTLMHDLASEWVLLFHEDAHFCGSACGARTMALTDAKIKSLDHNSKRAYDSQVSGLFYKASSKGHGKWTYRYTSKITKKRRDMGLGSYPNVSLSLARELAMAARSLNARGIDPTDESKSKRLAQSSGPAVVTFEDAARNRWNEMKSGWKNPKHAQQWIRTLETFVFPHIGSRSVATLKASDFADVLRPIWLSKFETSSRIRQRCHEVMKWCWANELVASNQVDLVANLLPAQPKSGERVRSRSAMPWELVPDFVQGTLQQSTDVSRLGLEFIILTAARNGEVRGAQWSEIDFENALWTIPAHRMKAKKPHQVPLSDRAIAILRHQKQQVDHPTWVFPSPTGKKLSDMAFTSFLRKHKIMGAPIPGEAPRTATAHGFRASFRDWASHKGFRHDLAERALAHTIKDKTEAAYHRTKLLEERRGMMEAWSDHVCSKSPQAPNGL